MSGKPWSDAEMAILQESFPSSPWRALLDALPGRTRGGINLQARLHGLSRSVNRRIIWTSQEEAILRRLWPAADEDEIVAAFRGRHFATIGKKASALGLRRRLPGARKNTRAIQPIIIALRKERERQGLTRPQLAARIGYHWQQLHGWEMGKACPIFAKLVDWVEGLGMELVLRPGASALLAERPAELSKERLMAGRA